MQTLYLLTLDDKNEIARMEFIKKNLTEIQTILDEERSIPKSYVKSTIRQNLDLDNIKTILG